MKQYVNDSWCPPSTCNDEGTTQWPADNYRPKFVDVPFSSIDASLSSIQPTW
ncbi:hypothetical protein [Mucilaginibacter hurinus]|uniref:hypothetical protein n=1 Tax=Mucilaginibacter hurinus TaxID=2201324 RepID=UPI00131459E6|nr:hypothetical protein [Mucilaginibacter hurinus]